MELNNSVLKTQRQIKEQLSDAEFVAEANEIRAVIGNPKRMTHSVQNRIIFAAMYERVSLEGVANRFLIQHGHYLRFGLLFGLGLHILQIQRQQLPNGDQYLTQR